MREAALANFFVGRLTAAELAQDVHGSIKQVSDLQRITEVEDMKCRFLVTREMAIALCDAVLNAEMAARHLETIGFALVTSDNFYWDEKDDEPAETFYDWSSPQINFPLTIENIEMFRARLLGR